MNLSSPGEWLAWAGVVVPLAALAWAAVFYTISHRREVSHQEYKRFFEVTNHLGDHGGSIASKMAAAFELRRYPQYKSVTINICERTEVKGPSAQMLIDELQATADFLRSK
jgi:hypothetical protein